MVFWKSTSGSGKNIYSYDNTSKKPPVGGFLLSRILSFHNKRSPLSAAYT